MDKVRWRLLKRVSLAVFLSRGQLIANRQAKVVRFGRRKCLHSKIFDGILFLIQSKTSYDFFLIVVAPKYTFYTYMVCALNTYDKHVHSSCELPPPLHRSSMMSFPLRARLLIRHFSR